MKQTFETTDSERAGAVVMDHYQVPETLVSGFGNGMEKWAKSQ